jgi:hypothetical protein
MLKAGQRFPDERDLPRLENYRDYRRLFFGDHDFLPKCLNWQRARLTNEERLFWLTANFAGLLSRFSADLLFGETPQFLAPGDTSGRAQGFIDELVSRCRLHPALYEAAIGASYRGDTVLKVSFRRVHGKELRPHARIESVPADMFYPEFNPNDVKQLSAASLRWTVEIGGVSCVREEYHTPGRVEQALFRVRDDGKIAERLPLSRLGDEAPPEEVETGLDVPLLIHVPNFTVDDAFWGLSDYIDLVPLQDELNNRLTRLAPILDLHSDPGMNVPEGLFDEKGRFPWSSHKVLPIGPDGQKAEYLTWDGKLDAAFAEVDKLVELAFLVTETSSIAFGLSRSGYPESGRALKLRLQRSLAKIARKRLYFNTALRDAFRLAMKLENSFGAGLDPVEPQIIWRDGLPDDPTETVELVSRLRSSKLISIRRALEMLAPIVGLTPSAVDDEIGQLMKEQTLNSGEN